MISALLQKFYYIPIIITWLFIFKKYGSLVRPKLRLLKSGNSFSKVILFPLLAIILNLTILALLLPFSYDEAFTFNHFTFSGPIKSLSHYPAPNNHVFHSILTSITWFVLGFTKTELSVRLPALLFSAFTLYFIFTRYLAGQLYAVVLFSVLFLFSPNIIEFAFQARGYSIQICCAIVSYFFATRNKVANTLSFIEKLNIVLLISVLGMFTSPAYLYSAASIYLIFISVNFQTVRKEFFSFIVINIFYALTFVLLYTPIIVVEGLNKITGNDFVAPLGWFTIERLMSYLKGLLNYITLPEGLGYVVILLFIWHSLKQKLYYNFILLVIPVVMMCVLKQLPFERVFLPIGMIILVNASLAITENNWLNRSVYYAPKYRIIVFLLMTVGCVVSYCYFNQHHKKGDLAYAYSFRNVEKKISGVEKVYSRNLGWDLGEMLGAHQRLKKAELQEIDTARMDDYDFSSAIIVSSEIIQDFRVRDSISGFFNKPILFLEPDK